MRNASNTTQKLNKSGTDGSTSSPASVKKLVQARLNFRSFGSENSPTASKAAPKPTPQDAQSESRKRKLVCAGTGKKDDVISNSKNISKVTEHAMVIDTESDSDVMLLEDVECVVVVDDDVEVDTTKAAPTTATKTPKPAKVKRKGAGTPGNASASKETSGQGGTFRVKLKFPFGGDKTGMRRKSAQTSSSESISSDKEILNSSDDIDKLSIKLNPLKRAKIDDAAANQTNEMAPREIVNLDSKDLTNTKETPSNDQTEKKDSSFIEPATKTAESAEQITTSVDIADNKMDDDEITTNDRDSSFVEPAPKTAAITCDNTTSADMADIEADDEHEITINSSDSLDSVGQNPDKTNPEPTETPTKPLQAQTVLGSVQKKNLTPKQLKLMEQRRKAREEKERKLQEERLQKQREKLEKEMIRKREREEKDEQRQKEREDKDEQRRKEREDKERKRIAEVDAKNEEKRKRTEAKEEETRKKEEDRKRREQEKEESELKKKKAAAAFTKFFMPKATRSVVEEDHESKKCADTVAATLAFRPFQIKGDMKLAPICRKILDPTARHNLELIIQRSDAVESNEVPLYLSELKSGKNIPIKWRRPSVTDDDDVVIVGDEFERAGEAILEETHQPTERLRAKFYKFQENRRPPFYGTWRKTTNLITPRRPLAQDTKYFDYDVDSDLEWEEEEPGESLDGSEDDKEKESEDDDCELYNEWYVPHGHLSEEELQNEDDIADGNTREAQKAKMQLLQLEFAQEMKKKTEKIRPRLIGCIWVDENGNQPELCPKIIWDTINQYSMLYDTPIIMDQPEDPEPDESTSPNSVNVDKSGDKLKRIVLSDKMLKDLVRLVHGNRHSKVFMINEFIAFVEANEESIKNGDFRGPLKSSVREKIDEFALWQVNEVVNKNKKNKMKKRLCWVVSDDVLKKMELTDLGLYNDWQYTLQPKFANSDKAENASVAVENVPSELDITVTPSTQTDITKYTTILTAEEKAQKLLQDTATTSANNVFMPKEIDRNTTQMHDTKQADGGAKTVLVVEPDAVPPVKKRVPLLMSVARGQSISMPVKNALISEFLKKTNNEPAKHCMNDDVSANNDDPIEKNDTPEPKQME